MCVLCICLYTFVINRLPLHFLSYFFSGCWLFNFIFHLLCLMIAYAGPGTADHNLKPVPCCVCVCIRCSTTSFDGRTNNGRPAIRVWELFDQTDYILYKWNTQYTIHGVTTVRSTITYTKNTVVWYGDMVYLYTHTQQYQYNGICIARILIFIA